MREDAVGLKQSIQRSEFNSPVTTHVDHEWRELSIGDIADVRGRIGWKGYTKGDLRDSGPLVIGGAQISTQNRIDLTSRVHLSREKYEESPEIQLQEHDIILVKTGNTIGKAALVDTTLGEACINPNTVILRPNLAEVYPPYLFYVITSTSCQKELWSYVVVGAQPSLNQTNIRSVQVLLPSLPEQRKIARVLAAWDRTIEQLEALIAAKTRFYYGLAQRLLTGRLRFKAYEGKPLQTVRLGEVTREMRIRNKGRFGSDRLYGVLKTQGLVPMRERVQGSGVENCRVVRPQAFAYNPMRLNIGSIARLNEPAPVIVSPDYVVFECLPDRLDPDYLHHFRRSARWEHFVRAAGDGSVRVRIYYSHLARMKMSIPSLDEQKNIAKVLTCADTELAMLQRMQTARAEQKKGLMQRLLTGHVRVVPDPEDYQN